MELHNTLNKVSFDNGRIQFNPMINLQEVTAVKILTILWTNEKYSVFQNIEDWFGYDDTNISTKVLKLSLPKSVINAYWFKSIAEWIGSELISWIRYHKSIFRNLDWYLNDIVWTVKGNIDYQQTALHMLQKQQLGLKLRFEIACMYCLEDEIKNIFPLLRSSYIMKYSTLGQIYEKPMMFYFINILDKRLETSDNYNIGNRSMNVYMLHNLLESCEYTITVGDHRYVALKYLWNKLTEKEKSDSIFKLIEKCGNNWRLLILSQLDQDMQKKLFNKFSVIYTDMLDKWYSVDYFLPTIIYLFPSLTCEIFCEILEYLIFTICYINDLKKKYRNIESYRYNFKVFWKNAPKHLKESLLVEKCEILRHVLSLLHQNLDLAQFILSDLPADKKEKVIFSKDGLELCANIIIYHDWKILKTFTECFLEEVNITKLKRKIILEKGILIIHHLLSMKQWDNTEIFIKWALKSDEQIKLFKEEVIFINDPNNDEYEMFHSQNRGETYQLYLRKRDIKCIEKIFSKSLL